MERVADRPIALADAGCVICEAPLESARCGHCGAAQAPGGHRVIRLLSQKPHARVYLARAAGGEEVVLKELAFQLALDAQAIDAFERETKVLASLEHPNIPRVLGSFSEGQGVGLRLYQVQEFVPGESLAAIAARDALPDFMVEEVAQQLLRILRVLHERTPPLLHRDVKPANLIRRPNGQLALVDFGTARSLSNEVTHGATLVGTFGYMAPEQLGGTVGPRSDLYAVGATLLHLLTGRPPTEFVTDGLELRYEHAVPEHWRAFLRGLLAKSPRDRFASAAEAIEALATKQGVGTPSAPNRSSRRLAFGAALFACVLGGALLLKVNHPPAMPLPPGEWSRVPHPPPDGKLAQITRELSSEAPSSRLSALTQLLYSTGTGELPPEMVVALEKLLDDPQATIRQQTARVLSMRGGESPTTADKLLAHAEKDSDDEVRTAAAIAAARVLTRLPASDVTSARTDRLVARMLTDSNESLRVLVASELASVHPLSIPALQKIRALLDDSQSKLRNVAMAILIGHIAQLDIDRQEALGLLLSRNSYQRQLGTVALSIIPPDPTVLRDLANTALGDPDETVRTNATLVLKGLGEEAVPATPIFAQALRSKDALRRTRATEALQALPAIAKDVTK